MRIRTRLLLLLIAIAAVPALAVGLLAWRDAERALSEAVAEQHRRTARAEAEHAATHVLSLATELGGALVHQEPLALGPSEAQEFLIRVFLRRDRIAQVGLFDARGELTASVFVDDPEAFARQEPQFGRHDTVAAREVEDFQRRSAGLLSQVSEDRAYAVSAPYLTAVRRRPAVVVVARAPGTRAGGLAAELGLEDLSQRLAMRGVGNERVFLLDGAGRLLLDGEPERERRQEDFSGKLTGVAGAKQTGLADYEEEGRAWLAAFSPVPELGWVAVVARPREAALAPLHALARSTFGVLGLTLVGVLALAPLLARALARPIARLAEGARELARGNLAHRISLKRRDELGDLARAFNDMGQALEQAHRELLGFNEQLAAQVEERTRELQQTQVQLSRSQRLAAMGDLAAGMAHEMNNPLAAVLGNVQLMLMDLPEEDPSRRMLGTVHQQAQRIASIVRELQLLSERQQLGRLPLDLHRMLQRVLESRDAELSLVGVRVDCQFHPGEVKVLGDTQALGDVFGRLLGNALNAMRDRPERNLVLSTQVVDAELVRVEMRDTGRGIAREHLERIFNPFFTTKQQWTGKGLSLAVCHRVIEDHGGTISLDSHEGVGTTVTLVLPAAPASGGLV
ncbi:C4-dicarboxylate-specific signal transduction histidine kinase [Archangium gephyra]|uniref:histidine kinase n=1 Tax=Archangium gephyra TaxID=48 RepID=A0AAC8Q1L4_9BACT|nr:ATP-binding protein [Archangium gephyra]AKI99278.1 Histidine kinase [Archangium gephyra]REG15417.1 C4-dicarboxylate-specific signal transduction histidine kinase [Archangium gephyra]